MGLGLSHSDVLRVVVRFHWDPFVGREGGDPGGAFQSGLQIAR